MQKVFFQNLRGEKLAGIFLRPERENAPCVVICHGLGSSKSNKEPIMEAYAEAGLAALAFDFAGHGESEGEFENLTVTRAVEDARAAMDHVSSLYYIDKEKIGMFGHSLGGVVSLLAAAEDKRIKSVAVSSPPIDFMESFKRLPDYDTKLNNLTIWKERGFTHMFSSFHKKYLKLAYAFLENAKQQDIEDAVKRIRCPVLVVQGSKDSIVPITQTERLMELLNTEKDLKLLDTGHDFSEKDLESLIRWSRDWFLRWL